MADIEELERSLPEVRLLSQMTREKHECSEDGSGDRGDTTNIQESFTKPSRKQRPWSTQGVKSLLSPSPTFIEPGRFSKDDTDVASEPVTPKRPSHPRGLSLQMPPRDISSTSTANLTKRIPVSPKPDSAATYPSPTSVLPRRSRGMDFSRAATNLHHSTLVEQSSPESSPIVGGRRGIMIPNRKSLFSPPMLFNVPESPSNTPSSLWTAMANPERTGLSSSVGSSSVMDNESGSTSSDEDAVMDYGEDDDTIHMTPQMYNNGIGLMNPFGSVASSPGGDGVGTFSPAATKLISYQRARVTSRRSRTRKSSSSASGHSSMQSPGTNSPPLLKSIESNLSMHGGYFLDEPTKKEISSRRESLSLGTNDMQLSDAEQSDDGGNPRISSLEDVPIATPITPSMEERKQVVRRAVTRRSNMLPKSKNLNRIRAALLEEGAPIDTEVRREAEVIRQVRESDADGDTNLHPSQPTTTASSPNLGPVTAGPIESPENLPEDSSLSEDSMRRRSSSAFTNQAIRHSGGVSFWNNFDEHMRTPPPSMVPTGSSSGVSEDINMDVAQLSAQSMTPLQSGVLSTQSHDPSSSTPQNTTGTFEVPRKGNKRMREDDFDPNYFKRRAVSPGLSVQNSPVLPQSPGWWDTPQKGNREVQSVSVSGDRMSSTGSSGNVNGNGGSKRVGLQGMTDTNDGLMNMTIE